MQDTELSPDQIAAINFARLWSYDENNRHNEHMLNFQELALDPEWEPDDEYVIGILTIKNLCNVGDTDKFGCIVGGCEELFDVELDRDVHQNAHLAQHNQAWQRQQATAAQPQPQPNNVPAPRRANSTRTNLECFGCDFKGSFAEIKAHKPSCPKTKRAGNSNRYKGGYSRMYYTCFNCNYFTAELDKVKAHNGAGCTRRDPQDDVGYDLNPKPPIGTIEGATALDQGVGYLCTEHGWERMVDVAVKLDPNYSWSGSNPQGVNNGWGPQPAPTPTVVPTAPVPQAGSDIDLTALPDSRYASVDDKGRVWFFLIKRRKKDSTNWGWKRLYAGDIEVKRYESDNLNMIGVQKVSQSENFRTWSNFTHHADDMRYILANPAGAAKLYAVESQHCYVCGKKLTDPESIRRGIGPDCFAQGKGFAQHRR